MGGHDLENIDLVLARIISETCAVHGYLVGHHVQAASRDQSGENASVPKISCER